MKQINNEINVFKSSGSFFDTKKWAWGVVIRTDKAGIDRVMEFLVNNEYDIIYDKVSPFYLWIKESMTKPDKQEES